MFVYHIFKTSQFWLAVGLSLHKENYLQICMPPFEKGGAYCFAHIGRSVGMSVGRSVYRYP